VAALPYGIILAIIAAILVFLLIPVSLRFDSTHKHLTVTWMGLSLTKRLGKEKPRPAKETPEKEKKRTIKAIGKRLLKDKHLTFELLQKAYGTAIDMLRSVSVRKMEATFSTPDPLWNGMLWGIFSNIHLENVDLSVNFQDVNDMQACLEIYPYRIVNIAAGLLIRLPYRRIIRAAWYFKKDR
jgi:hypothetical protein